VNISESLFTFEFCNVKTQKVDKMSNWTTLEPRYSAIEWTEKFSHKIEVRTISRSILKGFFIEGTKNFLHYIEVRLYLIFFNAVKAQKTSKSFKKRKNGRI
jgi:hypothetical protein